VGITSPSRFLVRDGALADLPEKVICMVDMNLGLNDKSGQKKVASMKSLTYSITCTGRNGQR
jgi:hypothetical protein